MTSSQDNNCSTSHKDCEYKTVTSEFSVLKVEISQIKSELQNLIRMQQAKTDDHPSSATPTKPNQDDPDEITVVDVHTDDLEGSGDISLATNEEFIPEELN